MGQKPGLYNGKYAGCFRWHNHDSKTDINVSTQGGYHLHRGSWNGRSRTSSLKNDKPDPEMPQTKIIRSLEPYGKVGDIADEMWSQAYQYKDRNGVLRVQIEISPHVLFHLTVGR
jgi:hypothetical protein